MKMKKFILRVGSTLGFFLILIFAVSISLYASDYTISDVTQNKQSINIEKGQTIVCNSPTYVVDICEIDGNNAYISTSNRYVDSFTLDTSYLTEGMHKVIVSYYYTQNVKVFSEATGWTYEKVKGAYAGSNGFIINVVSSSSSIDNPSEKPNESTDEKISSIITNQNVDIRCGSTLCVIYSVLPANATNYNFICYSENSNIAEAYIEDNGASSMGNVYIQAKKAGTTNIVLKDTISSKSCTIAVNSIGPSITVKDIEMSIKDVYIIKPLANRYDVKWSFESADKSIVTVDNSGKVIANAVGATFIKVVETNSGVSKTIKVVVTDSLLERIGQESYTLTIGDYKKLEYKSNSIDDDAVKLYSSNNDVVRIVDGLFEEEIEAVGYGVATITAKDFKGNSISWTIKVVPTVDKPIKKPVLTARAVSKTSVKLTWDKIEGVSGYYIYRYNAKNKTYEQVKNIKGNNTKKWIDKGLVTGKKYSYKIKAYYILDGKEYVSKLSNKKSAKPRANRYFVSGKPGFHTAEYGEIAFSTKEVRYNSKGQIVYTCYVKNERIFYANKFTYVDIELFDDETGKVIAYQKFKNVKLNLSPYKYKKLTFVFDKGTKIKNFNLRYALVVDEVAYEYIYLY